MCYRDEMTTTGLRELRQQASDLVRKAEAGETIIVTVNGREVAQLGPVLGHQWRRSSEIRTVFAGPADPDWTADRDLIDNALPDPFTR